MSNHAVQLRERMTLGGVMSDRYEVIRGLSFPVLSQALGIDLNRFKQRKGGTEWSGPCPVHDPKKNSSSFSYSQNGAFQCFSCGAKGKGGLDLAMKVKRMGFQEAVNLLEPYAAGQPVRLPQEPPREPVKAANEPFKGSYHKFFKPHEWLTKRGLENATLERFGSGYYLNEQRKSAYNGSVMLKISRYSDGECLGYISRNIGEITPDKPKYRFPAGFAKSLELFGAYQIKEDNQLPIRYIYLVESPFCVMKFWQLGLKAVSPFGWSVSPQQLDIIRQLAKGVIYLPDQDKSDEVAQYVHALSRHMWVKTPDMPTTDPEHMKLEQIKALA